MSQSHRKESNLSFTHTSEIEPITRRGSRVRCNRNLNTVEGTLDSLDCMANGEALEENKSSPKKLFLTIATLSAVPFLLMWEVLVTHPNAHLANPGMKATASTVTDLDGAARLAYLLSDMATPWANTHFISAPNGASIWRVQAVTQAIQITFLWVFSHVVSPMMAANFLVFVGWMLTGIVTYLLAKEIGCTQIVSICAAVAMQLTPSMRFMSANFTSYVFVAVPLITILMCAKYFKEMTWRRWSYVLVTLTVCGFFDPYWFFLAVFGCTIFGIATSAQAISKRDMKKGIEILAITATFFLSITVLARLLMFFLDGGGNSRTIAISSKDDVQNSVLNLASWSESEFTGLGWPSIFLIAASCLAIFAMNKTILWVWATTACSLLLLSSQIYVPFLDTRIIPAMWLRHVMPGVRFFDRAALVAIPILLVLVSKSLEDLSRRIPWRRTGYFLSPFAILILPITFPNLEKPQISNSYDDWTEIRDAINREENPRVLALPFSRRGRDWIEQASFQAPLVNDFVTSVSNNEVINQASNGPGPLAKYLWSNGVTHVFSVDSELGKYVDYSLDAPRFVPVGQIMLNGFGEGADFKLIAYKINPQLGDQMCIKCSLGPHVRPDVEITGDLVYPPEVSAEGYKSWWIGDTSSTINLKLLDQSHAVLDFRSVVKFRISKAPCTDNVVVEVHYSGGINRYSLKSLNNRHFIDVVLQGHSSTSIDLKAFGQSCRFEDDPRKLLIQVSNVRIS